MSELGNNLYRIKQHEQKKIADALNRSKLIPIGIKTPVKLSNNSKDSLFEMNTDIIDTIEDNLKNLIMTQIGERLGFPDYGTDLSQIYSDNTLSDDEKVNKATQQILTTVSKYMPSLTLQQYYSQKIGSGNSANENLNNKKGLDMTNAANTASFSSSKNSQSHINKNNKNLPSKYQVDITYTVLDRSRTLTLIINSAV